MRERADRGDVGGEAGLAERQHRLWRVGDGEQLLRGLVDLDVRGLRRKGYGDDQGIGVLELQFGAGIGRGGRETVEQGLDAGLFLRRQAGAGGFRLGVDGHGGGTMPCVASFANRRNGRILEGCPLRSTWMR
jgi:hypothetical protein